MDATRAVGAIPDRPPASVALVAAVERAQTQQVNICHRLFRLGVNNNHAKPRKAQANLSEKGPTPLDFEDPNLQMPPDGQFSSAVDAQLHQVGDVTPETLRWNKQTTSLHSWRRTGC